MKVKNVSWKTKNERPIICPQHCYISFQSRFIPELVLTTILWYLSVCPFLIMSTEQKPQESLTADVHFRKAILNTFILTNTLFVTCTVWTKLERKPARGIVLISKHFYEAVNSPVLLLHSSVSRPVHFHTFPYFETSYAL